MKLPLTIDLEDRRVAVLREVWPEFAAYVRRLLRDEPHMVEDIMNDAAADFTLRWRDKGEMDRNTAAATLKQAAKGDVLNYQAKDRRRNTSPVALDDELLLAHADPNSDREILAVLGRIDHELLLEQLPKLLTERQRQVIAAVDVEGLTQQDAARQLGISVRGLQKIRNQARDRLRYHLTTPPSALLIGRMPPRARTETLR